MDNLYNHKVIDAGELFDDYFLDVKALYLHCFNRLPDLSYIGQIDGEKAFEAFKEKFGEKIGAIHTYRWFNTGRKEYEFNRTVVRTNDECLLEFDSSSCEICHGEGQLDFVTAATGLLASFKARKRRRPLEINMVVHNKNGIQLKAMEISRTRMDLGLFYGEAFRATDVLIRSRLNRDKDKGIVLLHGLPGAGKTTYLRYLIGRIKKKVLFLSPSVAGNLMNPDLIELLIGNPNTVLIIEDAENIVMDRKHSQGSSVSTLLNISDGLLADFLNVQLICTFNNSLTMIDNALLRKGRLIAKYEFGKLSIDQSQRLSDHLGFDTMITRPMTVAEIANQHEHGQEPNEARVIGFARQAGK